MGKAVLSRVDGITVLDALVIAGSRFHDPNEPMDLANTRANGVRSLAIHCHQYLYDVILNVDHVPGHLTVPSFGPKMVCTKGRDDRRRCVAEGGSAEHCAFPSMTLRLCPFAQTTARQWLT
jgi:hypothetical protein